MTDNEILDSVPQSIESEQAVLGALLLDNDAIDRCGDLRPEHFYRGDHRAIYAEIHALLIAGQGADNVTVYERLKTKGADVEIGYLNSLSLNTPSTANVARYAEIIRDRAAKRQLISLAGDMRQMASGADGYRSVVDRVQARLELLAQERAKSEPVRASDDLPNYFDRLQAAAEGEISATPTGFRDLDEKLGGGLRSGELVIVAGRPSMGKTAFALAIADAAAVGGTAAFLSMEMPRDQLHERNISMLGKLPLRLLRRPHEMQDADWNRVTYATQRIADMNLFLDDQPALTLLDVRSKARAVKRKHGLSLLVVDYLGLMTGGPKENRNQEVGSYSRGLKALAKELNIPVIALAQLNRELERRADKRPTMADLRDSGEIEQDADIILFLYRDEVYNPNTQAKGICEVLVEKQRMGEKGMVPLGFQGEFTLFHDLARGYTVPEPSRPAQPSRAIRD
ncbi:replicative DNA helicase [Cupriavidus gilardii]|uniref:replicative DNA helicase n=1 Tax=Cupriavidus gilardii TaxID=82541 RepID=UPI0021B321CB|nr:replicative DNA helicase [Cupriavidus gilardii]UXC37336.1 replicative DNA helicase [Cupriavidus gilardii]